MYRYLEDTAERCPILEVLSTVWDLNSTSCAITFNTQEHRSEHNRGQDSLHWT